MSYYNANTNIKVLDNRKQAVLDMIASTQNHLGLSSNNYARFIRTIRYQSGYSTLCIVSGYDTLCSVAEIPMNAGEDFLVHQVNTFSNTVTSYKIPMTLVEK